VYTHVRSQFLLLTDLYQRNSGLC